MHRPTSPARPRVPTIRADSAEQWQRIQTARFVDARTPAAAAPTPPPPPAIIKS